MLVLGVDPGFAHLGLAVLELTASSMTVLVHETLVTSTEDGDPGARLDTLADRVLDVLEEHAKIIAVGYEDQGGVIARLAQSGNGISAAARRVLDLQGIVRCAARCYDLPCYEIAPATVKVALLGKGGARAPKSRMKEAVRQVFGIRRCSEHAADAIAIGVATGVQHRRARVLRQTHESLIH